MRNCYTYRVGWSRFNKYYYGVRFAKGCHPADLWVAYFTSSRHVKAFRKVHGEPDIIEVRKTFGDEPKKAAEWEQTVLRRLNIEFNELYLNRSRKNAFGAKGAPWNVGRTKENCPVTHLTAEKISKTRKGFKASEETKKKLSMAAKGRAEENSWKQLLKSPAIRNRFHSYKHFLVEIENLYESCWGIAEVISKALGVNVRGVAKALERLNLTSLNDQQRTKVYNKYGNKFSSYSDYCISILVLHLKGYTPSQIGSQLDVNECGVGNLLLRVDLTPNKAKTGPSKPAFKKVLIADALEAKSTTFTLEDNPLPESLIAKLRETVCHTEDLFHTHILYREASQHRDVAQTKLIAKVFPFQGGHVPPHIRKVDIKNKELEVI
jgi:hypothetical protein